MGPDSLRQGRGALAGALRLHLANHAQHLVHGVLLERGEGDGRAAGEQLIQDRAQGVDVAARVDVWRGPGLLRAHVLRRAQDHAGLRGQLSAEHERVHGGSERLGDAEVDHLGHRLAVDLGDEDVRGLQVAVQNGLLMSVLHRLADGKE